MSYTQQDVGSEWMEWSFFKIKTRANRPWYDGVIFQVGDIDFYPNGGIASMTGCEGEDVDIGCSHGRAPVCYRCLRSDIVIMYRVSGRPIVFPPTPYLWHPWSDQTHISHVE